MTARPTADKPSAIGQRRWDGRPVQVSHLGVVRARVVRAGVVRAGVVQVGTARAGMARIGVVLIGVVRLEVYRTCASGGHAIVMSHRGRPSRRCLPIWTSRPSTPGVRAQLRGLSKDNAGAVAAHLLMTAELLDDAPELALAHARAARGRAPRVGSRAGGCRHRGLPCGRMG